MVFRMRPLLKSKVYLGVVALPLACKWTSYIWNWAAKLSCTTCTPRHRAIYNEVSDPENNNYMKLGEPHMNKKVKEKYVGIINQVYVRDHLW
jgi:hypothetical protein